MGLNVALIPRIGLIGSAYATVAAYALQGMLADRIRRRVADVPWQRRVELRAAAASLLAVAAGALAPASGAWLVARGVVAVVLLGVFTTRLRSFLTTR